VAVEAVAERLKSRKRWLNICEAEANLFKKYKRGIVQWSGAFGSALSASQENI